MKSYLAYALAVILFLPTITLAHGFHSYVESIITYINSVIIPFLLGLGFLFFVINAIRFFVLEGSSEDGREKAKNLALYSVLAITLILVFWGVLSVLGAGVGLAGHAAPTPDYLERSGVQLK